MELAKAQRVAARLCQMFAPVVAEIVPAGSIRREKPVVKDVELVACLREDLTIPHAEHEISSFVLQGVVDDKWEMDRINAKNGRRYKRFVVHAGGEFVSVDLFIADSQNFGNLLAIRTGDADWTRLMVTRGSQGLMPNDMAQRDGYLWRGDEIVACRTEIDYFNAIGIPYVSPPVRTRYTATQLIHERTAELCPR